MSIDVVQLIVAIGGTGVLTAFINALFNKRKLSAEATQIITNSASSMVERLNAEIARLEKKMVDERAEFRKEIGVLEGRVAQQTVALAQGDARERHHLVAEERNRAHLERWHRYCQRLAMTVRDMGGVVDDPPPLFPEPLPPPEVTEELPHVYSSD